MSPFFKCPQGHCDRLLEHTNEDEILGLDDPTCPCLEAGLRISRKRGGGDFP